MKLLSLNTWCGLKFEQLREFLKHQAKEVDIFCFQEVRNGAYLNQTKEDEERISLFNDMKILLPEFKSYYSEMVPGVGMAMFIRESIKVEKVESLEILSAKEINHLETPQGFKYYPRIMQSAYLKDCGLIIHNFHGIPGHLKKDTTERGLQTSRLLEVINKSNKAQVLVGDFNLNMSTESIARVARQMRNLVKDSGAKTTRNSNYNQIETLPFADYAFVSPDIKINEFKVLADEVSDHLALLLDFDSFSIK